MDKKRTPINPKNQPKQVETPKVPKVWKAEDYVTPNISL